MEGNHVSLLPLRGAWLDTEQYYGWPVQKSSSSTSIASSYSDSHWSRTSTLCSAISSPLPLVRPPDRKPRRQVRFKLAEDDAVEESIPPVPCVETTRELDFVWMLLRLTFHPSIDTIGSFLPHPTSTLSIPPAICWAFPISRSYRLRRQLHTFLLGCPRSVHPFSDSDPPAS
jgi:hypothetical protein